MGLESLSPIGLGIDAGAGALQSIYGLYEMLHGNKKLSELQRPTLTVDPLYKYNQQLAGQQASEGFSDSSKNFFANQIDRGLGSTINAALKTGEGLGTINNAFQSSNDAFQNLLAQDAIQKQKNQQILMGANKDLAEENLRAWDYNVNAPYQQAFAKYTQQTNSGAQNLFGGLKGIGADFTSGGFDSFLKQSNGTGTSQPNYSNGTTGGIDSLRQQQMYQQFLNWMKQNQGSTDYTGSINTGGYG